MAEPLRDWEDWQLAQELRFRLRFEHAGTNAPIDMHSQILCEAIARILERLPAISGPSGMSGTPVNTEPYHPDPQGRQAWESSKAKDKQ